MKKVLIFSLAYYPRHVSGAEAAIKEITDRIEDVEFHMVTLRFSGAHARREKVGNVFVHRVGGASYVAKILFPVLAALKARRLHQTHRFDALWAMMTYMLLPVVIARMVGVHAPHILTLQDGDPYEKVFERWFIRPVVPLLDRGFRTASVVQAISKYLAQWPRKRGYEREVVMIPNGANPRDLAGATPEEEVNRVKNKFGKKGDERWLVNTARLVHQKGNDVTIKALTLLPEYVKFLVVGGGPEQESLQRLVQEVGVGPRVIFTGPVDRSEVTLYRLASDIFVGPSRSEGLGNAFLSAMASRIPVVATREGGLAEFVFDNKTAWVVEKDSPEQIAHAVINIIEHPQKVKEITEAAYRMVAETYNWDRIAREMRQSVFEKVL